MTKQPFDLAGRVALVVGGGSEAGRAAAVALAEAGADVALTSVSEATDEGLAVHSAANEVWSIGRRNLAVSLDVTDAASLRAAVDRVLAEMGRLDILVTSVDLPQWAPFLDLAPEEANRVLRVNLGGTLLAFQEAGRRLVEAGRGRVVAVVPDLTGQAAADAAVYSAAAAGVLQAVRALAREWAPHGVAVNAVVAAETDGLGPALRYLASDTAGMVTGQVLHLGAAPAKGPSVGSGGAGKGAP